MTIAQDAQGYLWVGTTGGLARFDGTRFSRIPAFDSLSGSIRALMAARDGSLWIATSGMYGVVRERKGALKTYAMQEGLPEGFVTSLLEAKDGTIWAGGSGGLARFRNERWESVSLGASPAPNVDAMIETSDNTLLICTSRGIVRYPSGGRAESLEPDYVGLPCHSIGQDGSGQVWMTDYRQGLRSLNGPIPASSHHLQPDMIGMALLVDRQDHLWVSSRASGLVRLSGRVGGARLPVQVFSDEEGLAGHIVGTLFEDREGNIWVGTDRGLKRVSVSHVTSLFSSDQVVKAVAKAGEDIWVGTSEGLIRFSQGRRTNFSWRDGLPRGEVNALDADPQGTLWIGTSDGSVAVRADGRFRTVPATGEPGLTRIRTLTVDRKGTLWIGDEERGLFQLTAGTLKSSAIPALRDHQIRAAFTDRQGRVWFGFSPAAVAVADGQHLTVFSQADGMPMGAVNSIGEDADGRIWLASDGGLSYFEKPRFVTVKFAKGLSAPRAVSITFDESGSMWLGVSAGVLRVDHAELEKALTSPEYRLYGRLYDDSDGLRGSYPTGGYPNVVREHNGTLWFATSGGIALFDPRGLTATSWTVPRVAIESVSIDEHEVASDRELQLSSPPARLQISYTALSLSAPTKVRFRHMLEGLDSQWLDDGLNRQVTYAHLGPGKYRFRVAATSGDGIWDEQQGVMALTVPPPFVQTKGFFFGCAALIGLLAAISWRWRERQIQARFALVLAERARVSRELHDTLLQSLVGIAMQIRYISSQLAEGSEPLQQELARMRAQVEYYVKEAQESIRDLRSPTRAPGDLVAALERAGKHVTSGTPVTFELLTSGVPRLVPPRVQRELLHIAHEGVTNAVRHGAPSTVRVELTFRPEAVHLVIADDGRGFTPPVADENGQSHWGLQIMRERAAQINGTMTISSAPDRGTAIDVLAPLN